MILEPNGSGTPTMRWKAEKKRIPGNLKVRQKRLPQNRRGNWDLRLSSDLNTHEVLHICMHKCLQAHTQPSVALVLFSGIIELLTIKCYLLQPTNLHPSLKCYSQPRGLCWVSLERQKSSSLERQKSIDNSTFSIRHKASSNKLKMKWEDLSAYEKIGVFTYPGRKYYN